MAAIAFFFYCFNLIQLAHPSVIYVKRCCLQESAENVKPLSPLVGKLFLGLIPKKHTYKMKHSETSSEELEVRCVSKRSTTSEFFEADFSGVSFSQ